MSIPAVFRKDTKTSLPNTLGPVYTFYDDKFMGRSSGDTVITQHNTIVPLPHAQGYDGAATTRSWWQIAIDYVDITTDFYSFINPAIVKRKQDDDSFAIESPPLYTDITENKHQLRIVMIGSDGYTALVDAYNSLNFYGAYILEQEERTVFNFSIENRKVYSVVYVAHTAHFGSKAVGDGPISAVASLGSHTENKHPEFSSVK